MFAWRNVTSHAFLPFKLAKTVTSLVYDVLDTDHGTCNGKLVSDVIRNIITRYDKQKMDVKTKIAPNQKREREKNHLI